MEWPDARCNPELNASKGHSDRSRHGAHASPCLRAREANSKLPIR